MFKLNRTSTTGKHNSRIVCKWYTKSILYGWLYEVSYFSFIIIMFRKD